MSFAWILPFSLGEREGIFVVYSSLEDEEYILGWREEVAFIGKTRNKYTEMLMIAGEDFH